MQIEIVKQETYGLGAIESTLEFENKVNKELMRFKELDIEVVDVEFKTHNRKLIAYIKINK